MRPSRIILQMATMMRASIISTNVGEAMRPLHEVASGGELSRIMLAMKSCLANQDDTPTLVFDEIDVGISGRTAQEGFGKNGTDRKRTPGDLYYASGADRSYGRPAFLIEKKTEDAVTRTQIYPLNEEKFRGRTCKDPWRRGSQIR